MSKDKGYMSSLSFNNSWRIRYLSGFIFAIVVYFYLLELDQKKSPENRMPARGYIFISICSGISMIIGTGFIFNITV